jgi:DnaK suppressor protein
MKTEQIQTLQAQLLQSRQALLHRMAQQRGGASNRVEAAAEHFGHPEDSQAQVTTERDLDFAMTEMETAELNALQEALERIAAGTYGECTDCGKHIAAARLQATPEAARCIDCQEAIEKRKH